MKPSNKKFDIRHLALPTISKKQWDRFTPKTKRVKLALDVLARLAMGAIKPVRGEYFNPLDPKTQALIDSGPEFFNEKTHEWEEFSDHITEQSAQKLVTTEKCEVCAKG